jgi:hypothetical protein
MGLSSVGRITMALVSIEGQYKNGRVDLSEKPVGIEEARVVVTFLPDETQEEATEEQRQQAVDWLARRMEEGFNLGGGPYYTKREEIYDERFSRFDKGNR